MSISFKELLGKNLITDVPIKVQQNMEELLKKMNVIRAAYGQPMTVTSGLRTLNDHLRIYSQMNPPRFPPNVPMRSRHLSGEALDIADADGKLKEWCAANEELLRSTGLWMEAFEATPTWCHFQSVPYGSYKEGGSLWFRP